MITIFLLSACNNNLRYFTDHLYEENQWSEDDLQRIQFYLSEDIVLRRQLRAEDSRITDGKIVIVDGSEAEEIVFKRGTPGLVIFTPKSDRFAVSFENDDDRYLMFGPNPKTGGRFVLLAKGMGSKLRESDLQWKSILYHKSQCLCLLVSGCEESE